MASWFVEVDFVPAGDGGEVDHAEWICDEYEQQPGALVLHRTSIGHEKLIIPLDNVRSIGISESD